MCDPVTATIIGVGAASGGYGAYKSAESQNQALEYNARLAENDALVKDMQAKDAIKAGNVQAANVEKARRSVIGKQRSAFAASGVDVASGSAANVLVESNINADLDAMTTKRNAAKEAWSLKQEANALASNAKFSRLQKQNPWEAATLSLLSSGSQAGSTYALSSAGGKTSSGKAGA